MGAQARQHREMGYTRFVQNGRVALINYGPDDGKLVMIVDVVDQTRCVVYSPDVPRQMISYKRLSLTDIVVDGVGRGCRKATADKLWGAADPQASFASTGWGKKLIARKAKASSTDFDRFKTMVA